MTPGSFQKKNEVRWCETDTVMLAVEKKHPGAEVRGLPRLFRQVCADLALAHLDGRYPRLMRSLGKVKLLILDDWGLEPLDAQQRHDLMEILEERYGRGATLITSQVPVDRWHDIIGDPPYADAILDRLVHNAHRIALTGDSLRRLKRSKTTA